MLKSPIEDELHIEQRDDLAIVSINRPEKRNAINARIWHALPEVAAALEAEAAIKVVILTGSGGHFSAGADIVEFAKTFETRESAMAYGAAMGAGIEALAAIRKPMLAAINGACIGGGVALALACDVRIAAEDARLAITPANLGMLYPASDTRRLADAIGISAAKRLLFTAEIIDGRQANAIGLIDTLTAPGEAMQQALKDAARIAAVSQFTVRGMKHLLNELDTPGIDAHHAATFVKALDGPDFLEGRSAFIERRKPGFAFR